MELRPPKSISDQIYEHLKERIIHSQFAPGQRLVEAKVAKELSVSRTPVREGFLRLEQDGLVERLPQGGVVVRVFGDRELRELYGIRLTLETYALELACEKITPEVLAELRGLAGEARRLVGDEAVSLTRKQEVLFHLNTRFHETIYASAENVHLGKFINDIKSLVLRFRSITIRDHQNWLVVWQEHEALIDALERRDKKACAGILAGHIGSAVSYALRGIGVD